jgi:hypothetical protein
MSEDTADPPQPKGQNYGGTHVPTYERPRPATGWMRTGALLLFAAALLSMALVHHPETGWNVNTRLALVFAVVDQGTFSIDAYHESPLLQTEDKAFYEGRFYSDKIFGVSLLALPVYAAAQLAGEPSFNTAHYLMRVFAVSLPAAISVALMWLLMVRLGAMPRRALFAVAAAFWGSLWFGNASIFLPYAPGIACLLGALWLVLWPRAFRITFANVAGIGALLGFAMLCDLTFGIAVIGVGIVLLLRLIDQGSFFGMRAFADMKGPRSNGKTCVALLAVGVVSGLAMLLPFVLYTVNIFGAPTIPYEYEYSEEFRAGMSQGFMGVTMPEAAPLWFLTLHPFRGILFWSPWIVLAIAGMMLGIRDTGRRRVIGWLALAMFAGYLLFNAGYYMWWGGWNMGPRLMLPMFAFVPLALAEILRADRHRAWWFALLATGAAAVVLNMPVALTEPQTPHIEKQFLYAATLSSEIPAVQFRYWQAFFRPQYWAGRDGVLGGEEAWALIRSVLAILLPVALLAMAARKIPARHEPFEEYEVPHIHHDLTTAPPPSASPQRS